jgi:hypothetical protein
VISTDDANRQTVLTLYSHGLTEQDIVKQTGLARKLVRLILACEAQRLKDKTARARRVRGGG